MLTFKQRPTSAAVPHCVKMIRSQSPEDEARGASSIPMTARLVMPGEGYGIINRQTNEYALTSQGPDPLIEFYDLRYTEGFTPLGQFVSRYKLRTLVESVNRPVTLQNPGGVLLDTGCREWAVGAQPLQEVVAWAQAEAQAFTDRLAQDPAEASEEQAARQRQP